MNRKARGIPKSLVKGYPYNLIPYLDPAMKQIRQKLAVQPVIPEIVGQNKIRYPLKAVGKVLGHSNIPKLSPELSLKGIVGSKYMHAPSGSDPLLH